jgi:hypothetical protein
MCAACDVEYVGRASGSEMAMDRIMYGRWSNHVHNDLTYMELDRWSTNYAAIRGREQQMIDFFGGAVIDNHDTPLRNMFRGVAKANPLGLPYWSASNKAFGPKYE